MNQTDQLIEVNESAEVVENDIMDFLETLERMLDKAKKSSKSKQEKIVFLKSIKEEIDETVEMLNEYTEEEYKVTVTSGVKELNTLKISFNQNIISLGGTVEDKGVDKGADTKKLSPKELAEKMAGKDLDEDNSNAFENTVYVNSNGQLCLAVDYVREGFDGIESQTDIVLEGDFSSAEDVKNAYKKVSPGQIRNAQAKVIVGQIKALVA